MIHFTGDVHRKVNELLRKLDYKQIPHTSDQIIVLLGDVGVNYVGDVSDCVEKQKLQNRQRKHQRIKNQSFLLTRIYSFTLQKFTICHSYLPIFFLTVAPF